MMHIRKYKTGSNEKGMECQRERMALHHLHEPMDNQNNYLESL
jgi:hypothetical protein